MPYGHIAGVCHAGDRFGKASKSYVIRANVSQGLHGLISRAIGIIVNKHQIESRNTILRINAEYCPDKRIRPPESWNNNGYEIIAHVLRSISAMASLGVSIAAPLSLASLASRRRAVGVVP